MTSLENVQAETGKQWSDTHQEKLTHFLVTTLAASLPVYPSQLQSLAVYV